MCACKRIFSYDSSFISKEAHGLYVATKIENWSIRKQYAEQTLKTIIFSNFLIQE